MRPEDLLKQPTTRQKVRLFSALVVLIMLLRRFCFQTRSESRTGGRGGRARLLFQGSWGVATRLFCRGLRRGRSCFYISLILIICWKGCRRRHGEPATREGEDVFWRGRSCSCISLLLVICWKGGRSRHGESASRGGEEVFLRAPSICHLERLLREKDR